MKCKICPTDTNYTINYLCSSCWMSGADLKWEDLCVWLNMWHEIGWHAKVDLTLEILKKYAHTSFGRFDWPAKEFNKLWPDMNRLGRK